MPSLLLVDDEPDILLSLLRRAFQGTVELLVARTAAEGLAMSSQHHPNVILLDVMLPDQTGLDVYRQLRQLISHSLVIFITSNATTDTAIEAMKLGAYDYLLKPIELAQLQKVVDKALEISRLMQVPAVMAEAGTDDNGADAIVGRCPAMQEVYKSIGRVAMQDMTVLILGESGTGKELVARAIYQHSRRAAGHFLAINCAAIPENLLESELFGHEKGAFTGAERRRIGKFEQCSGGTIFLDEIGDMPLLTQGKLLRLLQDQKFERLGSNETVQTDVRLLAATNQDLPAQVTRGQFRQDLFFRLNGFTIRLPPLRERGDDLILLMNHYLKRFSKELGKQVQQVAPGTMEYLRRYSWPGNLRELQSVLKQGVLQAAGPILLPDFLPDSLKSSPTVPQAAAGTAALVSSHFLDQRLAAGTRNLYEEVQQQMDKALLTRVLQHTGGNQLQAASILGISRGRLRKKLRELGLVISQLVEDSEGVDGEE